MSMEAKAFSATLFISLLPNLLLFFIPMSLFKGSDIKKNSYNYQNFFLAFASGGLLGDVFLHVLPHLLAEASSDHRPEHNHDHHHDHREHNHEEHLAHNHSETVLIYGVALISGYLVFLVIERLSSASSNDAEDDKTHKHDHPSSGYIQSIFGKISTSGWLNLIADSMHNFTDGIAIGASFAVGKSNILALTTFLSVLFHEIPHEIGDFSVLVNSGLTK